MTTATVRQSAWKRAGTAVEATSAASAAQQAGLNWTVSLHDLQARYTYPVSEQENLTIGLPVDNKVGVVKTHDGEASVIGVVGNKYKIVQNMEVFGAMDALVDCGDARYTAAGEYNNGASVWMLLELPTGVNVANDPHCAFLLVKTSHDGSSSVIVKPIIERLFCSNQINRIVMGKNKNAFTYTMKHTQNNNLSVADIRNITQLTYESIALYESVASDLGAKQVARDKAREYFNKVFPLPKIAENVDYHLLTQGEKRAMTIATEARERSWHIYSESDTQENIRGTAFGLWQAVIEYADHWKGGSGDRRALAAITGKSDAIKDRALSIAQLV